MVNFIISESAQGWRVARLDETVRLIAFVKTEDQAQNIAFEAARMESAFVILRVALSGAVSIVAMNRNASN